MVKLYIYSLIDTNGSGKMKKILLKNINPKISVKFIFIKKEKFIYDSNSIYLFLKFLKLSEEEINILKKLKKLNNYILYEPLDYGWKYNNNIDEYINYMNKRFQYFDMGILNSNFMVNKFAKTNKKTKFIRNYHEYDKSFKVNTNIVNTNVYYIGDLCKSSLTKDLMKKFGIEHKVTSVKTDVAKVYNEKIFREEYSSSIHIDYLKSDHVYNFIHTSTKLGTALSFNSIFICNRLPIYEELLGKDYEYFFNEDLSNLDEIIKKAKNTINNEDQYQKYLNKTKKIKIILSPNSILKNYEKIFFMADKKRINRELKKKKILDKK